MELISFGSFFFPPRALSRSVSLSLVFVCDFTPCWRGKGGKRDLARLLKAFSRVNAVSLSCGRWEDMQICDSNSFHSG